MRFPASVKLCVIPFFLIILTFSILPTAFAHPSNGDWIVTEPTTVTNQTIILTGNLIIYSSLTLDNVTLKMNSSYNGEFGIYVVPGGSLTIKNDSIITALNPDEEHKYIFSVYGGHLEVRGSEVSYCVLFMVQTAGSAVITDSQLVNNNYGIYIFNTENVQVIGNTITSSGQAVYISGVVLASTQKSSVRLNTVTNYQYGILLYSSNRNNLEGNVLKDIPTEYTYMTLTITPLRTIQLQKTATRA